MRSAEKYFEWFRTEAENLPRDIKFKILSILAHFNERNIYIELDKLCREGTIPNSWREKLEEYCEYIW
jgi:hypothetical protein